MKITDKEITKFCEMCKVISFNEYVQESGSAYEGNPCLDVRVKVGNELFIIHFMVSFTKSCLAMLNRKNCFPVRHYHHDTTVSIRNVDGNIIHFSSTERTTMFKPLLDKLNDLDRKNDQRKEYDRVDSFKKLIEQEYEKFTQQ